MDLHIDNMACGGCAQSVTKAILSVDPQAKVDIDLASKAVTVTSNATETAIAATLENAGYPPRPAT